MHEGKEIEVDIVGADMIMNKGAKIIGTANAVVIPCVRLQEDETL